MAILISTPAIISLTHILLAPFQLNYILALQMLFYIYNNTKIIKLA